MNAKELLALENRTKLRDKLGDKDDFFFASELKQVLVMELQLAGEQSADEFANRFELVNCENSGHEWVEFNTRERPEVFVEFCLKCQKTRERSL